MLARLSRTPRTQLITITVTASAVLACAAVAASRHSAVAGWSTLGAFVAALAVVFLAPSTPALSMLRDRERFEITDWGVRRYEHRRQQDAVAWSEVEELAVITTPQGPTSEDLYLVLRGRGGTGVLMTREAAIESGAIAAFTAHLARFDAGRLATAMQQTGDGFAVIWTAAQEGGASRASHPPLPTRALRTDIAA